MTKRECASETLAVFTALAMFAAASMATADSSPESFTGELCASPPPVQRLQNYQLPDKSGSQADCSGTASNLLSIYDPTELYTVQVVVHVIMDSTCTQGIISDQTVADQIQVLNEDFLALPGTNGANGADTQIQFELATEDPDGNPTTGITRSCNDTWYNDSGDYWDTLAWDPSRYVNIYTNTVNGAGGYVPFFAFDSPELVGTNEDRVVVNSLGFGVGGPVVRRSLGHLTVHELGHYLGLVHTFIGGCASETAPGCYTDGDLICDTNPGSVVHTGCPTGVVDCGGLLAPIHNYMALTDDQCLEGFSYEQGQRMRCTLLNYRPGIFTSGSAVCGNGVREGAEECDGSDLGGATCGDFGCSSGTLSCTSSCTLDTSACTSCGVPMEWGTTSVDGAATTVLLAKTYTSPVVVTSVNYANNTVPIVTRVSNVTSTSFDVRLQNPSGGSVVAETVSYLVVEEGAHTIDGVQIEARTITSTVTDENNSWAGEVQSYLQSYTSPVVLGQVMSEQDGAWSVFWNRGGSRTAPPSATSLAVGKEVAEDPVVARNDETLGFIVIEAGHGTIGGVEYEAALGADTVRGIGNNPPYTYTFNTAFASAPAVTVVTMAAMDGGNGGWAYTFGPSASTASTLGLAIDEDQLNDSERNHTTEQVGYVVFASSGSVP